MCEKCGFSGCRHDEDRRESAKWNRPIIRENILVGIGAGLKAELDQALEELETLRAICQEVVTEFHANGYSTKFVDGIYRLEEALGDA